MCSMPSKWIAPGAGSTPPAPSPTWARWCPATRPCSSSVTPRRCSTGVRSRRVVLCWALGALSLRCREQRAPEGNSSPRTWRGAWGGSWPRSFSGAPVVGVLMPLLGYPLCSVGGVRPVPPSSPKDAPWVFDAALPLQVLGKSCKPIPVMLLGVTLLRKRYPPAKYLCVLLIVAGVALFLYKPKRVAGSEEHVFGYGELLLLLSLTLDGLTGVSQDHMRAHYQTGSNHMMLNVNLWSTLFLGAGIVFTGELWEFLSFTERFPGVIYNILLFGLTSALGQSFIFMTVVYFGPLTCSIITTTRKFFTILASVILFANPISSMQWVGTVLVFLGLGLDAKFGKGAKKTSH
uniref:Solute carrier family 35 member B1 n=1 Tax=Amazona collaria TaxID=241587 RepID=A0A8B9FCB2_9PSIT